MRGTQSSDAGLDESDVAILIDETNHRIRNLLAMIEAIIGQTQSTNVEDYRAQLTARIGAFRRLIPCGSGVHCLEMTDLIEQALRPYCGGGEQVLACGPDLPLPPKLAFALYLVFNELALNAKKYGSLSCPDGQVGVQWKICSVVGASRKLAIVWAESGGPEVKAPRRRGFGSRLFHRALDGYGGIRLGFNKTGLTCSILLNLDHPETRTR